MLRPYIDQGRESYRRGTSSASTIVVTMLVTPTTPSTGVHDLRVSISVTPPIFENSQNPLSFIHVPTSDPLAAMIRMMNPAPIKDVSTSPARSARLTLRCRVYTHMATPTDTSIARLGFPMITV